MSFIKKYANEIYLFIFFLFVISSEILLRIYAHFYEFNSWTYIFDIFFSLALCILISFFNKRIRVILSLLISTIICLYITIQSIHYNVFSTFFSVSKIDMLSQVADVKNSLSSIVEPDNFIFLIPLVILYIVSFVLYKYLRESKIKTLIHKIITLVMLIVCIGGCFGVIKSYPDYENHLKSYQYLYEQLYNKKLAVKVFGIYNYCFKDIYNTCFVSNEVAYDNLQEYIADNGYQQIDNQYTNLFKDKNLILIEVESLSSYSINEDVTPFLYSLLDHSYNFVNHYAPLYDANTFDSAFMALNGVYPSTNGASTPVNYYYNNYNSSLAQLFNQQGYTSYSYHSNYKEFYNRDIIHQSYGFKHFYAQDELSLWKDSYKKFYNWSSDVDFFSKVIDLYDDNKTFNFVITASSHMPYYDDREELQEDIEYIRSLNLYDNSQIITYAASLHQFDNALKLLVQSLQDSGQLQDCVIILFGDHYPYGLSSDAQQIYFGDKYNTYQMYQTPFIIYNPDIEGITIDKVNSSIDIYPTIANLFGLDIDNHIVMGCDLLSDSCEPLVIFSDYSWLNEQAYYDASKQKYIIADYDENYLNKIDNIVADRLSISQSMLDLDAFTYKGSHLVLDD